jgi:hypothetical protein
MTTICPPDEHAFTPSGSCIYCPACHDFQGVYVPSWVQRPLVVVHN